MSHQWVELVFIFYNIMSIFLINVFLFFHWSWEEINNITSESEPRLTQSSLTRFYHEWDDVIFYFVAKLDTNIQKSTFWKKVVSTKSYELTTSSFRFDSKKRETKDCWWLKCQKNHISCWFCQSFNQFVQKLVLTWPPSFNVMSLL